MISALLAVVSIFSAQPSSTPAPDSIERAAIMDEIRRGVGTDSVFKVERLVVYGDGSDRIAYAEVVPAQAGSRRPFSGWAVLEHKDYGWRALVAVGGSGEARCGLIKATFAVAMSRFELGRIRADRPTTDDIFSSRFYSEYRSIMNEDEDAMCAGSSFSPGVSKGR